MTHTKIAPFVSEGGSADYPPALKPIIDAIAASLNNEKPNAVRGASWTLPAACGTELVVYIRAKQPGTVPSGTRPACGLNARQLQLVEDLITDNISDPLTVEMLSSAAGLSRSYFSHAFRESVGCTPHAHVVRARIEHAKKLMTGTDASLSEIALAAGFADQAHFSKNFRHASGATPSQWRKHERISRNTRAITNSLP